MSGEMNQNLGFSAQICRDLLQNAKLTTYLFKDRHCNNTSILCNVILFSEGNLLKKNPICMHTGFILYIWLLWCAMQVSNSELDCIRVCFDFCSFILYIGRIYVSHGAPMDKGQRLTCRRCFSPSTTWVLRTELRRSGLAACMYLPSLVFYSYLSNNFWNIQVDPK